VFFKEYRTIFTVSILVLILSVAVFVVSAFWPRYEERFFAMGMFGKG